MGATPLLKKFFSEKKKKKKTEKKGVGGWLPLAFAALHRVRVPDLARLCVFTTSMPSLLRVLCVVAAAGAAAAQCSASTCIGCTAGTVSGLQGACEWCGTPSATGGADTATGSCISVTSYFYWPSSRCASSQYTVPSQQYLSAASNSCPYTGSTSGRCSVYTNCVDCASMTSCQWVTAANGAGSFCGPYVTVSGALTPAYPAGWTTTPLSCSCPGQSSCTTTTLTSGIITAIAVGVVLLVVLPLALLVAVCCCGVALCGNKRTSAGGVIQQQPQQVYVRQAGGYPQAYPQQQQFAQQPYPQQQYAQQQQAYYPQAVQYDNRMARTSV